MHTYKQRVDSIFFFGIVAYFIFYNFIVTYFSTSYAAYIAALIVVCGAAFGFWNRKTFITTDKGIEINSKTQHKFIPWKDIRSMSSYKTQYFITLHTIKYSSGNFTLRNITNQKQLIATIIKEADLEEDDTSIMHTRYKKKGEKYEPTDASDAVAGYRFDGKYTQFIPYIIIASLIIFFIVLLYYPWIFRKI